MEANLMKKIRFSLTDLINTVKIIENTINEMNLETSECVKKYSIPLIKGLKDTLKMDGIDITIISRYTYVNIYKCELSLAIKRDDILNACGIHGLISQQQYPCIMTLNDLKSLCFDISS